MCQWMNGAVIPEQEQEYTEFLYSVEQIFYYGANLTGNTKY